MKLIGWIGFRKLNYESGGEISIKSLSYTAYSGSNDEGIRLYEYVLTLTVF